MSRFNAENSRRANTLGIWLRDSRIRAGLSQKELSTRLKEYGVTIGSGALSKWETGEHLPSPYQLCAMALVMGTGDPLSALTEDLSAFNEEGCRKIAEYIDDLKATGRYARRAMKQMKVFSLPASAGTGLPLQDEEYEMESVPEDSVPRGADFGIRVRGDSMMPRFADGQTVWVQRCSTLRDGEIGVFVLDGEAFIKQLRHEAPTEAERASGAEGAVAVLVSLNEKYAPRRISPQQRLDLAGRVVE